MTAAARFKKIDIERAMKAARGAGYPSVRVEIEPGGKIVIIANDAESAPAHNPWDDDDD